jgi:hypothetical protein
MLPVYPSLVYPMSVKKSLPLLRIFKTLLLNSCGPPCYHVENMRSLSSVLEKSSDPQHLEAEST